MLKKKTFFLRSSNAVDNQLTFLQYFLFLLSLLALVVKFFLDVDPLVEYLNADKVMQKFL